MPLDLSSVVPRRRRGSTRGGLLAGALMLGACLAVSAPAASLTISSVGAWDGNDRIGAWGIGGTPSYAQSFLAPLSGNSRVTGLTFYMGGGDAAASFQVLVYQWNGSVVQGGAIAQSAVLSTSTFGVRSNVLTPVTVSLAGGPLTAGGQYLFAVTAAGVN